MEEKVATSIGEPVKLDGLTIIPVVRTKSSAWQGRLRGFAFGSRQAIGIIVISAAGRAAFRTNGEPATLEKLLEGVPESGNWLNQF